jgi:hypothetical protein
MAQTTWTNILNGPVNGEQVIASFTHSDSNMI